jgi:hypothetical protein
LYFAGFAGEYKCRNQGVYIHKSWRSLASSRRKKSSIDWVKGHTRKRQRIGELNS